jgi:hypothetical protein
MCLYTAGIFKEILGAVLAQCYVFIFVFVIGNKTILR